MGFIKNRLFHACGSTGDASPVGGEDLPTSIGTGAHGTGRRKGSGGRGKPSAAGAGWSGLEA